MDYSHLILAIFIIAGLIAWAYDERQLRSRLRKSEKLNSIHAKVVKADQKEIEQLKESISDKDATIYSLRTQLESNYSLIDEINSKTSLVLLSKEETDDRPF